MENSGLSKICLRVYVIDGIPQLTGEINGKPRGLLGSKMFRQHNVVCVFFQEWLSRKMASASWLHHKTYVLVVYIAMFMPGRKFFGWEKNVSIVFLGGTTGQSGVLTLVWAPNQTVQQCVCQKWCLTWALGMSAGVYLTEWHVKFNRCF